MMAIKLYTDSFWALDSLPIFIIFFIFYFGLCWPERKKTKIKIKPQREKQETIRGRKRESGDPTLQFPQSKDKNESKRKTKFQQLFQRAFLDWAWSNNNCTVDFITQLEKDQKFIGALLMYNARKVRIYTSLEVAQRQVLLHRRFPPSGL